MTKFGYHNGLVDQAYTDVMESICIMIDHAKSFHFPARTAESSLSHRMSPLAVQGVAEVQKIPPPFSLLPENMENVHREMTAFVTWNSGQAMPSQEFKSFDPVGLPAKRARVSSGPSFLMSSSEVSGEQNMSFPLKAGRSMNPLETQQEISDFVESRYTNHKLSHTGPSTGQKTMISNWLSTINHQEMHNFNGSRRYRETGVWLSATSEFQYWRDRPQSSIFWLHGARRLPLRSPVFQIADTTLAGVGKSVLSYICLSKRLQPQSNHAIGPL